MRLLSVCVHVILFVCDPPFYYYHYYDDFIICVGPLFVGRPLLTCTTSQAGETVRSENEKLRFKYLILINNFFRFCCRSAGPISIYSFHIRSFRPIPSTLCTFHFSNVPPTFRFGRRMWCCVCMKHMLPVRMRWKYTFLPTSKFIYIYICHFMGSHSFSLIHFFYVFSSLSSHFVLEYVALLCRHLLFWGTLLPSVLAQIEILHINNNNNEEK